MQLSEAHTQTIPNYSTVQLQIWAPPPKKATKNSNMPPQTKYTWKKLLVAVDVDCRYATEKEKKITNISNKSNILDTNLHDSSHSRRSMEYGVRSFDNYRLHHWCQEDKKQG